MGKCQAPAPGEGSCSSPASACCLLLAAAFSCSLNRKYLSGLEMTILNTVKSAP